MKKLIVALILMILSTSAVAHGPGYGYRGYYRNGSEWVAPLIVGGVVGYVLAQPRQTVIIQQTPSNLNQMYGPMQSIYEYQDIYFEDCGCMKRVLIKIN